MGHEGPCAGADHWKGPVRARIPRLNNQANVNDPMTYTCPNSRRGSYCHRNSTDIRRRQIYWGGKSRWPHVDGGWVRGGEHMIMANVGTCLVLRRIMNDGDITSSEYKYLLATTIYRAEQTLVQDPRASYIVVYQRPTILR